VRPREPLGEVPGAAHRRQEARAVRTAVVRQDALYADPAADQPGQRPAQEARDGHAAFVRQDLDVGHARTIVDTDMHELPADAARALLSIPSDPMADVPDPRQLLDVQVQQLARAVPLVPPARPAGLDRT